MHSFKIFFILNFYPRDAMLVWVLAVCHTPVLYQNG